MYTRPALSLEDVLVPIAVKKSGIVTDPTADAVAMAFVPEGTTPGGGDWNPGDWETDASGFEPVYYARCLVGPTGTINLVAGVWDCYTRVTDTPEAPVFSVGQMRLT